LRRQQAPSSTSNGSSEIGLYVGIAGGAFGLLMLVVVIVVVCVCISRRRADRDSSATRDTTRQSFERKRSWREND
jgi:membrane protein required for beta-lactamase induction